ncbi:hypothetical protein C8J57DRAFT_1088474 [Mycena rebaudengoi]|nr:hypothetical protein C8J57DRAFT_1088543 [Mycena rebaudengoi]KAJ7236016.1 hypothetical protein C8J57DRAFT_1088474 [Mycena rebaudengoi]
MIVDYLDYQKLQGELPDSDDGPIAPESVSTTPFFVRTAVDGLSKTSASFLTRTSPLKSTFTPPAFKPFTISPLKAASRYSELLDRPVVSTREQELVDALREADHRDAQRKRSMIDMQAGVVLSTMYTNRSQAQLQAQEVRKSRKKGKRKMGDGKAKYFTGEEFFQLAVEDERKKAEEVAEKEQRKTSREAHATELELWKKKNDRIRARNEEKRATFAADTAAWEEERDAAKLEKRKRRWEKPKWKEYGPESLLARPKKPVDEDSGEDDDEGSGAGSDMDID